jgi:hypothetical protein
MGGTHSEICRLEKTSVLLCGIKYALARRSASYARSVST